MQYTVLQSQCTPLQTVNNKFRLCSTCLQQKPHESVHTHYLTRDAAIENFQ
jgi:hypothetical protein